MSLVKVIQQKIHNGMKLEYFESDDKVWDSCIKYHSCEECPYFAVDCKCEIVKERGEKK